MMIKQMLESSIVNYHNMSAQIKNSAISEISNIFAAYKDNSNNTSWHFNISLIPRKVIPCEHMICINTTNTQN